MTRRTWIAVSVVFLVGLTGPAVAWGPFGSLTDLGDLIKAGFGMGGMHDPEYCDQGMCEMMCDMMGHGHGGMMDPADCETQCSDAGHHHDDGDHDGHHDGGGHHDYEWKHSVDRY